MRFSSYIYRQRSREMLTHFSQPIIPVSYTHLDVYKRQDCTPAEYLASCLQQQGGSGESAHQCLTRARTFLGSLKYTSEEMEHPASELSGGQKAKLLLLRLILEKDGVLLLDEPTRNFSPLSQPVVRRVLQDFGGSMIAVSHDRRFLSEVCDTVYRLMPEGLVPAEKDLL